MHVNLLILTPGYSMHREYVKSLLATIHTLNEKKITWAYNNDYASHVANARETTLSGTRQNSMLETRPLSGKITYDKMLWIDSDISWTPEDVIKLYESDKDIISGAYLLGDGFATVYKEQFKPGYSYEEVLKMDKPSKIEGCGFGFLCVKSGVFESLSRPWFQSVNCDIKNEETGEIFNMPITGEDIAWCIRVRNQGYDIWFDPTVRLNHHKSMKLTWEGVNYE
jgi:hypothetical protein